MSLYIYVCSKQHSLFACCIFRCFLIAWIAQLFSASLLVCSVQVFCLSTMPKLSSWCTASKLSSSSQLYQLSWWELFVWNLLSRHIAWGSLTFSFLKLAADVLPPAGVERQFLSSYRPAGSQCGAKRPEEEQWHQQLQRQSHLDPSTQPAGRLPAQPGRTAGLLCPDCSQSHIMEELRHWCMMVYTVPHVCVAWQQELSSALFQWQNSSDVRLWQLLLGTS